MTAGLSFSPASERNKEPILQVLKRVFQRYGIASGTILEIGAGSGQHSVHFARQLNDLSWLPTDRQGAMPALAARIALEGSGNILPPMELDVLLPWPDLNGLMSKTAPVVAAYSANTAHIMSWTGVCAMFDGLARVLPESGLLCIYGPFSNKGKFNAQSNAAFDQQLRRGDPDMGIRDLGEITAHAAGLNMSLVENFDMPANNQLLVWRKQ